MVARGPGGTAARGRLDHLIENVGNLVCPALFDLGEWAKVAILSTTEGEDKPLKYPYMFRSRQPDATEQGGSAALSRFRPRQPIANARAVNPGIEVLQVSAYGPATAWADGTIGCGGNQRRSGVNFHSVCHQKNRPAGQGSICGADPWGYGAMAMPAFKGLQILLIEDDVIVAELGARGAGRNRSSR